MTKMISVRLEESLLEQINHERTPRGLSLAQAVKDALTAWVEQRRVEEAVRRHGEAYARTPVDDGEFGPLLEAQRWPR